MIALLLALFIAFTLNFLEPFSIRVGGFQPFFMFLLSGYGILGGIILWTNEVSVLPWLSVRFKRTLVKLGIENAWQVLTIALGICLYSHFLHQFFPIYHFPAFSYAMALEKTLLLGFIPLCFVAVYHHFQPKPQAASSLHSLIYLQANDAKDWLKIEPEQLLFLESADNYTSIYFIEQQQLNRKLLRGSLKHFETQIQDHPILRCHHSFIVNLKLVRWTEGNTRGLKLYLPQVEKPIPVSRKFISSITAALQALNVQEVAEA